MISGVGLVGNRVHDTAFEEGHPKSVKDYPGLSILARSKIRPVPARLLHLDVTTNRADEPISRPRSTLIIYPGIAQSRDPEKAGSSEKIDRLRFKATQMNLSIAPNHLAIRAFHSSYSENTNEPAARLTH